MENKTHLVLDGEGQLGVDRPGKTIPGLRGWYLTKPGKENVEAMNLFLAAIHEVGEAGGLKLATVLKEGLEVSGQDPELNKPRDCYISWIQEEAIIGQIINLFKGVNKIPQFEIESLEPLQYTVYNEGQYYNWHIDDSIPASQGTHVRKFTFTMWLNDPEEYEGGELEIEVGGPDFQSDIKKFKEDKGNIIFFNPSCYHRVTPITKGSRKALVGWFCGPAWK